MSQGGLEPNLQRLPVREPAREAKHGYPTREQRPLREPDEDEYDAAEQGFGTTPGSGPRVGIPGPGSRASPKPRGEPAPMSWFERNRSLLLVSLSILVLLVILLIWYQFTKQPAAPAVQPQRPPGAPRPPRTESGRAPVDEEAPAPTEPSEAVDESTQEAAAPPAPAQGKPKAPAVKKPAAAKPAPTEAKATRERSRVQADPIRSADDKEISEFANMDVLDKEAAEQTSEAEETEAS